MAELYRITVDGGLPIGRATGLDRVAGAIAADPTGRRHVRPNRSPETVATVDLQLGTCHVFRHGTPIPSTNWPAWVHTLLTLITAHHPLVTFSTTIHPAPEATP